MRIGILTGGGDCPGLNGVIRGVVTKGIKDYGYEFVGFRDGWKGPLEGLTMELGIPQEIKDTALASQIGVVELTFAGKVLANKGFPAALTCRRT